MRAAGFGASAGQAFTAKGLYTDDSADDIAIHIHISDGHTVFNIFHGSINATVYTQCEPITGINNAL